MGETPLNHRVALVHHGTVAPTATAKPGEVTNVTDKTSARRKQQATTSYRTKRSHNGDHGPMERRPRS